MNLERDQGMEAAPQCIAAPGELNRDQILTAWDPIVIEGLTARQLYDAVAAVLPDVVVPRDGRALIALMNSGAFSIVGARWPDGLVTTIAWPGADEEPPAEAVEIAYRRIATTLQALRDLDAMEPGGHA